jgi:hypothetical protein
MPETTNTEIVTPEVKPVKNLKTRVMQKHDYAANWALATNFVPLEGEIIIYDADINAEGSLKGTYSVPRIKIGDGKNVVGALKFVDEGLASVDHGTHVSFSTANPVMDNGTTGSVGTATTVARSDHKHPSDTSRLSVEDFAAHTVSHAPADAEKNQNAFSKVVVGSTEIVADSVTDSLNIVAGSNITITPDASNDKITIAATNTTYSTGTATASGLTKLYTTTGSNTDGAMTQNAVTTAINNLVSAGTSDPSAATASQFYFKYSE